MHTPLMAQIDIFPNRQSLAILITEDRATSGFRLADDVGGAWIVEEAVVDAGGVPGVYAFGAAESGVAYEGVAAAVVGRGGVVCAVVVFLL